MYLAGMPDFAVRRLWISATIGFVAMVALAGYRLETADVTPPEPTADVCALVGPELLSRAVSAARPLQGRLDRDEATLVRVCSLDDRGRFLQVEVWHFGRRDGRDPIARAHREAVSGGYVVAFEPSPVQVGDESYEDGDERTAHIRVRLGATVIAIEHYRQSDALAIARLIAQEVAARCGC